MPPGIRVVGIDGETVARGRELSAVQGHNRVEGRRPGPRRDGWLRAVEVIGKAQPARGRGSTTAVASSLRSLELFTGPTRLVLQEEHVAGGVAPFEVHVPHHELDDLRERLARTRWLDEFPGSGWSYGTSRRYLEELCEYWRAEFDWRACEARLNAFGQVAMDVDGQRVHAIHARSPEAAALPLLLVHGWPGSVFEFEKVIEPLRDPRRHGGDASDAFHVVCPSIPGYGFSGPTVGPGWNVRRISAAFALLMQRLGYHRYGAAGGDWGAIITSDLVRSERARACAGCT